MNAKELRIGNYVEYNGNIKQVTGIMGNSTCFEHVNNDSDIVDYRPFKPIPLTPKWLEKFGFKYLKSGCWEYGCMRIYDVSDIDNVRFRIALAGHQLVVLKYVHELQNFHFVFTKKELV